MRTFIAIEIEEPLRKEFSFLQNELRKSQADVKWVEPKNMHLTLKFLGETKEEKVEKIKEVLKKLTQELRPFEITFCNLGAFPNLSSPRVIWIGIDKGKEELTKLARGIEEHLEELGFPKEKRPYSGHLTLGRIRSMRNKENLKKIIEEKMGFQAENELYVNRIVFFRSELKPSGPIYTKLAEFFFP